MFMLITHVAFKQYNILIVPAGMHSPISLFSEQILGARLYKVLWLNNQYKVIIFMKFISDVSKDILFAHQEPFLMVTFLHDFCFYGTIHPPKSHTNCFYLAHCQNPCHEFLFLWKKRKEKVKVTSIEYFNVCRFTETSTVPAQAD